MYEQFYGLKEAPFSLTPDTEFFFNYRAHQEALNVLIVALNSREGFIKVTGEVGTGKTLLCRKLLNELDDRFVTAYVPNPYLEPDALRKALASELGLQFETGIDAHELTSRIYTRLVELAGNGKQVVLCLDEAQALPDESLEALRLLTNLETEKTKLLQVVLFGQPELDERLRASRFRQLKQRITFSYRLTPMDREGVGDYVRHRLLVAGHQGGGLFNDRAIRTLYDSSQGIPRLINVLSHKALMAAFGQGARQVAPAHVRQAADDTEGADRATGAARPFVYAGLALVAFAAGAWLVGGWLG